MQRQNQVCSTQHRHHQVRNDQGGPALACQLEGLLSVLRHQRRISKIHHKRCQHLHNGFLIVGNEDEKRFCLRRGGCKFLARHLLSPSDGASGDRGGSTFSAAPVCCSVSPTRTSRPLSSGVRTRIPSGAAIRNSRSV